MSQPWTKEPWNVQSYLGKNVMVENAVMLIANCGSGVDAEANATRIVAAVNGCTGLNPMAYRAVVEALKELHGSLAGLALDNAGMVNPLLSDRLERAKQALALATEQP